MTVDGRTVPEEAAAPRERRIAWPVRSGAVPPLADGYLSRLETAADLAAALIPGATVVLGPGRAPAGGSGDWLASSGKTQVAAGLAESLWQSGKLDLLIWVDATSRAAVLSGYVAAAVAASSTDPAGDAETVAGRLVNWLAKTSRPWLLVLDDLSDPADLDGLWPRGAAGKVLITTADATALSRDHPELVFPVGVFSPREALSYLIGRLTADTDQRLGAIDLVEDLGCEPLALAQASSVIASSALSCRDYRDFFARRRETLAEGAAGPMPAAAVTWTFSFEQAERLSPGGAAQALLALAALLDGHGIPGALFTTQAACDYAAGGGATGSVDPARALNALLILERAGLLSIDQAGTLATVRMVRVMQSAVRAAMPPVMFDRAARAAADALVELWPAAEEGAFQAASLRSCAASLQQAAGDLLWAGGCHPLLLRAGKSLDAALMTGPAIAYWNEIVTISDRILGPSHRDTLVAGERLAEAYLSAGRAAEAVPWLRWALAKRMRAAGSEPATASAAQLKLGQALVAAKQFGDAITVLDGAVSDLERTRGAEDSSTLRARDELAAAYRAGDQASRAMRLYQRTLADRERIWGPQHPETTATREKLADAAIADGRVKEAIRQYKRALADREEVLGPDHPDTIAAKGNLGFAYHSAGRMASALQFYEQACAGYERVLGADHPDTLARRADLAHAYYTAGRLTDATALLRDTAERCERVLPRGDRLTRSVQESLANIAGG
jgi:tetratricopeptide (TPR) repeat protein